MVIALDLGTSSARATLYDQQGRPVPERFHQVRYAPTVTPDGGAEHDPAVLLDAVATCLDAVTRASRHDDLRGVGVTAFWHGLLGFDGGGRPVTPVFTWADSRSAPDAALLRDALDDRTLHARTGCHLHSSYWPAKLRWLARERPTDFQHVARWGSIGEYLELALFGETATSVSMASGTGLLDQQTLRWDTEALAAAGVEPEHLFTFAEPGGRRGLRAPWSGRWPALRGVPWFPAVGDGAASNVGSDCVDLSRIALNVGTSAAIRLVTREAGSAPIGLWRYRVDGRRALVGGATSEGGNVHAWCRDVLKLPEADEVERLLAERAPDSHGLTLLPFLAGERAPGWRGDRRAVIAGLSLSTTALDIVHAAMEAVVLRLMLIYARLAPLASPEHHVIASGGAVARSRVWTQMLADGLGRTIHWSSESEATSRGAALLALEALGALPDVGAAPAPLGEAFAPDAAHHARYLRALERQQHLDERV